MSKKRQAIFLFPVLMTVEGGISLVYECGRNVFKNNQTNQFFFVLITISRVLIKCIFMLFIERIKLLGVIYLYKIGEKVFFYIRW